MQTESTQMPFSLASDNAAPVHPAILGAIQRANVGPALAYGHDPWTAASISRIRDHFGDEVEVLFVFNGTAANVLGLRTVVDSHQAVLCAETSHLWRDEGNAPEYFIRAKIVPIDTPDGKLTPDRVRPFLRGFGVVHHAQPRVISVTQPTEWGTLYTLDELRALAALAHEHGMLLHVDGARLANAAVALDVPIGHFRRELGIDILSLGGTKLGLLGADAVLLFDPQLAARAAFHRKQAMQLGSKMRFIAAQFDAMLALDLWRELALHANAMASRLGEGIRKRTPLPLVRPVETNAVFVKLPEELIEPLQQHASFHIWDSAQSIARLMTAWDTRADDVDHFVAALARLTA
jgi:threonine aldolase